jgi:hypothetical protein
MNESLVSLQARLAALESIHDWSYEFSDDHRVWTAGRDRAAQMAAIRRQIFIATVSGE